MSNLVTPSTLRGSGDISALSRVGTTRPEFGGWRAGMNCHPGVLVTGSAQRIGRAVAVELGRLGWHVAVHYRSSRSQAEDTCQEIQRHGGVAEAVSGDLVENGVGKLHAFAVEAVGPLGLLINNASIYEGDDAADLTAESWSRHQTVNALAPVLLGQAFVAGLPAGKRGNIINIIDSRVLTNRPRYLSYSVSKSTLWTATRLLARELAPNVRVNAIGPGPTLPEAGQSEEDFVDRCRQLPLEHGACPGDLANAIRFILETPSLTGQLLALDGGDHLID